MIFEFSPTVIWRLTAGMLGVQEVRFPPPQKSLWSRAGVGWVGQSVGTQLVELGFGLIKGAQGWGNMCCMVLSFHARLEHMLVGHSYPKP